MKGNLESLVVMIALNSLDDHYRACAGRRKFARRRLRTYSEEDCAAKAARSAANSFNKARSVQDSEFGVRVAHNGQGRPAVR